MSRVTKLPRHLLSPVQVIDDSSGDEILSYDPVNACPKFTRSNGNLKKKYRFDSGNFDKLEGYAQKNHT